MLQSFHDSLYVIPHTHTPAQLFKHWLSTVLLEIFSLSKRVAIETEVTSDIRCSISALPPVQYCQPGGLLGDQSQSLSVSHILPLVCSVLNLPDGSVILPHMLSHGCIVQLITPAVIATCLAYQFSEFLQLPSPSEAFLKLGQSSC